MTIEKQVELGLAEFIIKLIEETNDAVLVSKSNQLTNNMEILESVNLPVDTFADLYINDYEVDELLLTTFPNNKIMTGASINLECLNSTFAKQLNIALVPKEDFESEFRLTDFGVSKIRKSTKIFLAEKRMDILRQMIKEGIPKLIIDSGALTTKVNFFTTKQEDYIQKKLTTKSQKVKEETATQRIYSPKVKLGTGFDKKLPELRLSVKQPDKTSTSNLTLGEISIKFRVI